MMGRNKQMKREKSSKMYGSLIGKKGSMAGLHDLLVKHGFSYQSQIGDRESANRVLIYSDGKQSIHMVRIARGRKGQWLPRPEGATSWLAKTAGTADTYELRRS